jgi:serine/threonine-protein kinase
MTPPATIAHYRITGKLGEGGMGAVYRATDTKLNREVAIKIVPESLADSPDEFARFTREAQVLASLNHPNISAIYGVEDRALVMELVEGPTLAERIRQGPLSLEEALPLIRQMIDALEYAHEKGIVHRDLKPANIKITPEGRLKVLDFGLAKALSTAPDPNSSDSLADQATMAGVILGTAAYMAPEQARGQYVDRRADIWTFGAVVWEMLTGSKLFGAPSASDTLAAVLTRDPDFEAVPVGLRRMLRLCLTRDPRQRLRDISGARLLLDEAPAGIARPRRLPWIAAAIAGVIAVVLAAALWRATRPPARPFLRLSVDLGPDAVTNDYVTAAITADGKRLAFVSRAADGKVQLGTRLLDDPKVTLLAGTDDATAPFFSPDGEWIGFSAAGRLKKISVHGGAAVSICEAPTLRGASWGEDGTIVLTPDIYSGLVRVSDAGGKTQVLTEPSKKGERTHRWPQILPGGRTVLFTAHTEAAGFDNATIEALDLKTGDWKPVLKGGYYARYLPSGHLVYVNRGALMAVAFDAARLESRGTPVTLYDDLAANAISGGGQFDFSKTGTLVYLKGGQQLQFAMLDAAGKIQPLMPTSGGYFSPRFSPDGKRMALSSVGSAMVYDIQRNTPFQLVVSGKLISSTVWSPDGKHIAYAEGAGNSTAGIWWIRADGSGTPWKLLDPSPNQVAYSFSPDGRRLLFVRQDGAGKLDIWSLPLDLADPEHPRPGPAEPFHETPFNENTPMFSSDGRWVAYMSDEGGTTEIYVRPFPPGSGRWQVSTGGGKFPTWSGSSKLFYESLDNRIMEVDYSEQSGELVLGKPKVWSETRLGSTGAARNYDVGPDGRHFVVMAETQSPASTVHVTFLLNFFDELRRRL